MKRFFVDISFLKASEIIIPPDRQRKDFNSAKIDELADSIAREGLIHPIAVERRPGGTLQLVAGERRLRALITLNNFGVPIKVGGVFSPLDTIPSIVYDSLDPINRLAIELMENIRRENLTWQEHSSAIAAYHALRSKQEGPAGQTVTATTSEIGKIKRDSVAIAIAVAEHLDDPEVSRAKDLSEAARIIQKKQDFAHRSLLARSFDLSRTPHTLVKGDCFDYLRNTTKPEFDILLTDPPYGIGADSFGDQASTGHKYSDDEDSVRELLDQLAEESFRACRNNAFAYVFCDVRWWERLSTFFALAGWTVWPRPLIWDKCGNGMLPQPDFGPRNTYECILYARKGSSRVIRAAAPDVLSHTPVRRPLYGPQKPVSLLVDLLGRVALPGARILDPFVGSGSTFIAANQLKMVCTGIELDSSAHDLALSRIALNREESGEDARDPDEAPEIAI